MNTPQPVRGSVPHLPFILLSIGAAVATVTLKFCAHALTGSVGLLSDAVESTANLVAAFTALFALWFSAHPADRGHPYGHAKIEFFSIGIEGGLIMASAVYIGVESSLRMAHPRALAAVNLGVWLVVLSAAINYAVGRALVRRGRLVDSMVLEGDGRHLLADVWTSLGVICGVALVGFTHLAWLDPLVGLCVALNIARIGTLLMRRAFDGLMDTALSEREVSRIRSAIESELRDGMTFHAVRTRRAGAHRFLEYHLLVPGSYTVRAAHNCEMAIGRAIKAALPNIEVTAHIEPIEEPQAWNDSELPEDADAGAGGSESGDGRLVAGDR
jgi:cation diffusion facilitator family transporter